MLSEIRQLAAKGLESGMRKSTRKKEDGSDITLIKWLQRHLVMNVKRK